MDIRSERQSDIVQQTNKPSKRLSSEKRKSSPPTSKNDKSSSCFHCHAGFRFLFNQKHCCFQCRQLVCRRCVTWDLDTRDWACVYCWKMITEDGEEWPEKSVVNFEAEVDSENDSGYHPLGSNISRQSKKMTQDRLETPSPTTTFFSDDILTSDGCEYESPNSSVIRNKVEEAVEYFIGGPLEDVPITKVFKSQEYDDFSSRYKSDLIDALNNFEVSYNNGFIEGEQSKCDSSKLALKELLGRIKRESRTLPVLKRAPDDPQCDLSSSSYEESLASVILNKIVLDSQDMLRSFIENDKLSKEIQTDTWGIGTEGKLDKRRALSSSVDIGIQSDIGVDDVDLTTDDGAETSSESSRSGVAESHGALSDSWEPDLQPYVVEEKIEEITTTYETESEASDTEIGDKAKSKEVVTTRSGSSSVGLRNFVCPVLDFGERFRVPFPELGMDLLEVASDSSDIEGENHNSEEESSCFPVTPQCWEENWLFKSGKNLPTYFLGNESQPLGMFVPVPDAGVTVRVGDKDLDELSDLSERHSIGSYDLSSDEQEVSGISLDAIPKAPCHVAGEVIPEFSQKDQEYTEDYASLTCLVQSPSSNTQSEDSNISQPLHSTPKTIDIQSAVLSPRDKIVVKPNYSSKNAPDNPGCPKDVKLCFQPTHSMKNSSPMGGRPVFITSVNLSQSSPRLTEEKESIKKLARKEEITDLGLVVPSFCPITKRTQPSTSLRFVEVPGDVVTHAGKSVRMSCAVEGDAPIAVSWFRGHHLLRGQECLLYHIENHYFCHMYNTKSCDSGTYSCVVHNKKGQAWHDFSLSFRGVPMKESGPSFVEEPRIFKTNDSNIVEIKFRIAGYPEPRVELYRGEELIPPSRFVSLSSADNRGNVSVCIQDLPDYESYRITLENKSGVISQNLNLNTDEKINCEMPFQRDVRHVDQTVSIRDTKCDKELSDGSGNNKDLFPAIGSIAAREHKKWENPISMSNNPYSAENLIKRMKSRMGLLDSILSGSVSTLDLRTQTNASTEDQSTAVINCGLKSIDSSRYRRDYYVNDSFRLKERKNKSRSLESLTNIKHDLMFVVEAEKRQNCSNPIMNTNSIATSISSNDTGDILLPSVKSLAKKFKSPEGERIPTIKEDKILKTSDILENGNILVITKDADEQTLRKENARKYKEVIDSMYINEEKSHNDAPDACGSHNSINNAMCKSDIGTDEERNIDQFGIEPKNYQGSPQLSYDTETLHQGKLRDVDGDSNDTHETQEHSEKENDTHRGTCLNNYENASEYAKENTVDSTSFTETVQEKTEEAVGFKESAPAETEEALDLTESAPAETEEALDLTESAPAETEEALDLTESAPAETEEALDLTESAPAETEETVGSKENAPGGVEEAVIVKESAVSVGVITSELTEEVMDAPGKGLKNVEEGVDSIVTDYHVEGNDEMIYARLGDVVKQCQVSGFKDESVNNDFSSSETVIITDDGTEIDFSSHFDENSFVLTDSMSEDSQGSFPNFSSSINHSNYNSDEYQTNPTPSVILDNSNNSLVCVFDSHYHMGLKDHLSPLEFEGTCVKSSKRSEYIKNLMENFKMTEEEMKAMSLSIYGRVHSLTARSVPREFREAVKQNYPKQPNRNIQAPPDMSRSSPQKSERSEFSIEDFSKMKMDDGPNRNNAPSPEHLGIPHNPAQITAREAPVTEGYTSDESITYPLSDRQLRKHPRKKAKSIASRAAFWDNRVKNGLVSDHSIIEEFPTIIPSET